ncbi:RNA polymerase sigma factor [Dyadobacter sp. CY323]|uniref:RNA polymerase sigma factor n=1 Tax=Dyadobacter sp. CY323 TaxID=2907302 RepID=UPI001F3CDEBF|nr:sigma-70 family RNA polymerase sigma factor [Dyadobacter sp. CY323]MCE6992632.1 sigma-70 family RNA polymerase sigma factor [Dyadobacter sp. CY323]
MDPSISYEETLWDALKHGNKDAFGTLYKLHYRQLYGYGNKFLRNTQLVEDAIQDLFVHLWNTRESLSQVHNVKFYLFRALRRDLVRLAEKSRRFEDIGDELAEKNQPERYLFEEEEQEKLLIQKLTRMLRKLPERQLEVVTLRFFDNFKTEEIAAIMGISEKSVRNTLYKALTHLREQTHDLVPFIELIFLLSIVY